ncbi:putative sulfate exporter family transporter [Pseudoroseomonas rhizosphaerae]|uniref:Putative sulfate exporter family transporter n=1 Tax=Teichococcus rhizosphaerae TaxID=1335062 RepID=A0A2C7AGR5_9PROT|nr:putative sulfate exporter family transporter [Pseudoroseomonas rhizosphaerae]PHK96386.1 putative sulfate exporter family transporter [Pseudoroseomonas rhizosphaerae]
MPPASSAATAPVARPTFSWLRRMAPGLLLCAAVSGVAVLLAQAQAAFLGRAWLDPLVLAILLGTALRSLWPVPARFAPGIALSAKTLLEVAVMLLGASLSVTAMLAAGPALILGIAAVVALAILFSYGLGRMLGLPKRMAMLVACGNSICGNSAIAAVAPVIGAQAKDVASAIAFTAVLGVGVVLTLPLLVPVLGLSELQYGVLAGLTVYAVPQVLAATAPVGQLAVQLGTLVKLVRVLMLGPVVLGLSVLAGQRGGSKPGLAKLVPWFILGFLGLMALRALGLIPEALLAPISAVTGALTLLAMAALGLGVDVRTVARAGGRVTATVMLSLLALGLVSLLLIRLV